METSTKEKVVIKTSEKASSAHPVEKRKDQSAQEEHAKQATAKTLAMAVSVQPNHLAAGSKLPHVTVPVDEGKYVRSQHKAMNVAVTGAAALPHLLHHHQLLFLLHHLPS